MFSWRAFPRGNGAAPGAHLVVPSLERDGIRVAFTMRGGGCSGAPFDSLNLSYVSGDDTDTVRANRARAMSAIGARVDDWTSGKQVHGATVAHVARDDKGRGAHSADTTIPDTDALWTDVPGVALAVLTADCVPIALADPARKRIGVVHAGWRGLVAGVIEAAAKEMGGSLVAFVGPSIGPCCYEVGPEVAAQAEAALGPGVLARAHEEAARKSEAARASQTAPQQSATHLDLWRGARRALANAGVRDVGLAALCTRCEPHRFFSHRAGHAARQGVVATIS